MADQVSRQRRSDLHARDYALNYLLYGLLLYQILIPLYPVITFWELIQSKKKNPNHEQCYMQEDLLHSIMCHWKQPKCPNWRTVKQMIYAQIVDNLTPSKTVVTASR